MSAIEEKLSDQFYEWENRGRGWRVFDQSVSIEPPFRPFFGHYLPTAPVLDDGRRPTFLSSMMRKLTGPAESPVISEPVEEPEPESLIRDPLIELQTSLPANLDINSAAFEQFLRNLSLCREPIAFELLGTSEGVKVQFAAHQADAPQLRRQLQSYFPEATFQPRDGTLETVWESSEADEMLAVEFGLAREFMFPLATNKIDPFIGIIGALSELEVGEVGLFQVLFQATREEWAESIVASVTHADGKPFFVNAPELAGAAERKVSQPLYAAVVRIAVKSQTYDRTVDIARNLASSLRAFANPQGNHLIPLTNDEYPFYDHIEDVLRRQSRRSGMLLNSDELLGFVHFPGSAVRSPALQRDTTKTKAAPAVARNATGTLLGANDHAGQTIFARLTPEQRVQHAHVIGASGTGKSTLLFNMIRQDIENGQGVAVLDPHGDLIDRILGVIPESRINDVILVDPSDEEYAVGFNILAAHSELEKNLLASDLISVFQRLSTSWGDQMNSVLQNAILAFLESPRRGTIADMRRFLIEPAYRHDFLTSVTDSEVVYYWQKSFPQLVGNKSIGSILTRLDGFLAQKPIRHMVSQEENRLDFAHIMDSGKIFLAKLPEGLLGKENSYLLGTLLVSKFQQLAMSRQAKQIAARRDFWIYIDEFHNFITPSMAQILAGARKYRIGLTLAHQELHQLERDKDVASAVLSNPYTRIVFRVGDADAKKLSDGFAFFEARDLQNLETGHAICRVEKADGDFNLSIPFPEAEDQTTANLRRQEVITVSREKYGRSRAEIEAMLRAKMDTARPEKPKAATKPPETKPAPPIAEAPKPEPKVEIPPPPVEALPKAPAPVAVPAPPRDLGRGGAQHQAIQKRIKKIAEEIGFRSTIEKEVLEGKGSVDLLLERADHTIACEISITTTIDHEVGNVVKCLKAGFSNIAVICLDGDHLEKIKAAVSGSLGGEIAARVSYYFPDQFITHLEAIPTPPTKIVETVKRSRGYKVKRVPSNLSTDEQKQREGDAIRSIADAIQRKAK